MIVVLPVVSVLVVFLARMSELRARRKVDPGLVKEHWTFRLFMIAGILMMVCGISEFFWFEQGLHGPTFVAGWLCALLSFYIRRSAIAALGRFWSVHVEIREHHQLVRTGPFRWMRHPTYLSMVLEMLSVMLMLRAFYSSLPVAVVFVPTLLWRLRLEESALVEKFGQEYRDYRKTTPALFPYRWP